MGCLGVEMGPRSGEYGAELANLAPRCAQAGELGGYLARFWEHLGDFFCILGAVLPKWAKTKKNDDSLSLLKVF